MAVINSPKTYLGIDMGEQRIGVAFADDIVPIAVPLVTVLMDGTEKAVLDALRAEKGITDIVVGRPRSQAGITTAQTAWVEEQVTRLFEASTVSLHYQDESLTSVMAEERLKARRAPYQKGDIDREAAAIILQDYLDTPSVQ